MAVLQRRDRQQQQLQQQQEQSQVRHHRNLSTSSHQYHQVSDQHQQAAAYNAPPSATPSRISYTGTRDYSMKFLGDIGDLTGAVANTGNHSPPPPQAAAATTTTTTPATYRLPLDDDEDQQHIRNPPPSYGLRGGGGGPDVDHISPAAAAAAAAQPTAGYAVPNRVITSDDYEDKDEDIEDFPMKRNRARRHFHGGHHHHSSSSSSESSVPYDAYGETHPFWKAWLWLFKGLGMMIGGAITLPFVFLHGLAKLCWSVPMMMGDDTIYRWPDIRGLGTGCVAALQFMFILALYQGCFDWAVLPVVYGRREGFSGVFKGLGFGFCSAIFKTSAGVAGFIGFPIYGTWRECMNIRIVCRRESKRQKKNVSPV